MFKVFLFLANLLAFPEKLMNRVVTLISDPIFSSCGITPIASPSNVNPCPVKEITLTIKGLFPYPFLLLYI